MLLAASGMTAQCKISRSIKQYMFPVFEDQATAQHMMCMAEVVLLACTMEWKTAKPNSSLWKAALLVQPSKKLGLENGSER